jgi:hypothetical protein
VIVLVILALLAVGAIIATFRSVQADGYRRLATRPPERY